MQWQHNARVLAEQHRYGPQLRRSLSYHWQSLAARTGSLFNHRDLTWCWRWYAGKYLGEHPMSYSTKSVTLGVFLWLRQAGNAESLCNEVSTIR